MRILLIEDNEMNRDMLSRRLARRGFEVSTAEDGERGIALAERARPDLIILDMSLPNLDGWDAARRLKANPGTRHIPIYALTAHAMPGDEERARQAGCDGYGTKPVEFERLISGIDELLKGSQQGPQGAT